MNLFSEHTLKWLLIGLLCPVTMASAVNHPPRAEADQEVAMEVNLQDIVIHPDKRTKHRALDPAVVLMRQVIAHKDSGWDDSAQSPLKPIYRKRMWSWKNPDFEKGFMKPFAFARPFVDSTTSPPTLAVSIREQLGKACYFQGLEQMATLPDVEENMQMIFSDVDIRDNSMKVLLNRFVSPLSSNLALGYYHYTIADTVRIGQDSCIRITFAPVQKEGYGFSGELYVVNDGSFFVKQYRLNLPHTEVVNFLQTYQVVHENRHLSNGLWVPYKTTTTAEFQIRKGKQTIMAHQTAFYGVGEKLETDSTRNMHTAYLREDEEWWAARRPEPLNRSEKRVGELVQAARKDQAFASMLMTVSALTTEYVPTVPAERWGQSKWDFGPVFSTMSWNMLEGVRLRVGGTTTANLNPKWFLSGYMAFGTADLRPKGEFSVLYSFVPKQYYQYRPLRHFISLSARYDVEEPGARTGALSRDNIFLSIPMSAPKMGYYQYVWHGTVNYRKEWNNHWTLKAQFDVQDNRPAGELKYETATSTMERYLNYELCAQVQYAPGKPYQPMNRLGVETPFTLDQDAPVITLSHRIGYMDDRISGGKGWAYNYTQITAQKRFWLSAFGYIDGQLQGGWIWNSVPFTHLYTPYTATGIILGKNSFNLLQPMELMMDRYVGWNIRYHLKGCIWNLIPELNKFPLRGVIGFDGVWGALSRKNDPYLPGNEDLYRLPGSPIGTMPYMELTAGIENIFQFIRIDYIRRLTYNDYTIPSGQERKIGAWGRNGVKISVQFEL